MGDSFIRSVVAFLISYQDALRNLTKHSKNPREELARRIGDGNAFDFAENIEGYFLQFFALIPGNQRSKIEKKMAQGISGLGLLNLEKVTHSLTASIEEVLKIPLSEEIINTTNALPVLYENSFLMMDLMARYESTLNPDAFLQRLRFSKDRLAVTELVRIGRYLQNHVLMMIKGRPYRITEIEAYYYSDAHADPFVHRSQEQEQFAHWYFHRRGETYREGKIKGLDLTFGQPGSHYGGFLIRGIAAQDEAGNYIDGPSRTVDEILARFGVNKVRDIAESLKEPFTRERSPDLHLISAPGLLAGEWCAAPRVGLRLKEGEDYAARKEYLHRQYRFHICPDQTEADRNVLFLALMMQGWSGGQARLLVNLGESACRRAIESFKVGVSKDPSYYAGKDDLSESEKCELLGATSQEGIRRLVIEADLAADESDHPHFQ